MNEFKNYHPIVNFFYFLFIIGFACSFMHPMCLFISVLSGFLYSLVLKGKEQLKKSLVYIIPMLLLTAIINPAFNHKGITVITYLPSGNPLTLESIIYGFFAGIMLAGVILWFSCFNKIMTSDKFIYLFGKVIPALSLVLSMTLRFVPRFLSQLKVTVNAQKCMGRDISRGNILKRAKNGILILGIMISWALENAIDTSDSMKARGYGLSGRTAFSIYTFDKRDLKALIIIFALGVYVVFGGISGGLEFSYFPEIKGTEISPFSISLFLSYFLIYTFPLIIELKEARKWKLLRSKI